MTGIRYIVYSIDAAHLMPPWGGFGANTGIADAHNLTWKLAAVLIGQATPILLHTYNVERRPIAHFAAEQSALRSDVRIRYGLGSEEETANVQKKALRYERGRWRLSVPFTGHYLRGRGSARA